MRTTKVYSIIVPPDLGRQAEALAKKENRAVHELVREYVRQLAPTPPAYQAIRENARRSGTNNLSPQQIDREVAAARRRRVGKSGKRGSK
jgi:hypothetical protein